MRVVIRFITFAAVLALPLSAAAGQDASPNCPRRRHRHRHALSWRFGFTTPVLGAVPSRRDSEARGTRGFSSSGSAGSEARITRCGLSASTLLRPAGRGASRFPVAAVSARLPTSGASTGNLFRAMASPCRGRRVDRRGRAPRAGVRPLPDVVPLIDPGSATAVSSRCPDRPPVTHLSGHTLC